MLLPLHLGQGDDEITLVVLSKEELSTPISIFIEDQLPEFVAINHSNFVDFIEEYVKWSESGSGGNPTYEAFNIPNTADIDNTVDDFVDTFKNQFLIDFPKTFESGVDQRKLLKNIKDFYKSKGTERSYKLLFRILFGEDPILYYPKYDILKASDGKWREPTILKVTQTNELDDIFSVVGRQVQQRNRTTNEIESYGFVEGVLIYQKEGYRVVELELTNTFGDFFSDGTVECQLVDGRTIYEYVYSTLGEISVIDGGSGYSLEDVVVVSGGLGVDADAKIESVDKNGVIKSVKLTNSGINYKETDSLVVTIDSNGGTGANLTVNGGVALDSRVGYYSNNNGLLSSNKKLQDNFYYQDFSYVIKSSRGLDEYNDLMKKLIHPAGTKMFSDSLMREIKSAVVSQSDILRKYETPLLGHYTSYRFNTIKNLRANGANGTGGVDLYPNGYGWASADGGTYVDESGSSSHLYGVSGPLGGSTHEVGSDDIHSTGDGVYIPVDELDIPQGEQFNVLNGGVTGATFGDYWLIYPHPNSRGITELPWNRTKNLYEIDIDALVMTHPLSVNEYVYQESPYVQDAVGIITKIQNYSGFKTLTIDTLSGAFVKSGVEVIGGTTGLLVGSDDGAEEEILEVRIPFKSAGLTANKFNYIQIEDFMFGIER